MPLVPLSSVLALALALVPAVVAWWTGRSVLARGDDPVLPELLVERRRRLMGLALGGGLTIALLFTDQTLWALPILWIGLLCSSYPLRRALFGERLTVLAYLRYAIFSTLGRVGLWLLLAATPAIIVSLALGLSPNDHGAAIRIGGWASLATLGVIVLWWYNYTRVFLAVHRATPFRESARPELVARFDAVLERAAPSLARRPEVYRYGAPGAYVMNALAIPSRIRPAVVMGDSLLATLTDDEIVAVFAHEVAHHEQFTKARWRRTAWLFVLLCVLIAALPALLIDSVPGAAMAVSWCMPVFVVLSLGKRAAARREAETASDLRAIALGGNARAMISALTKLHVYSRVPRRWPHAMEQAATHPSLARRIQALREASDAIEHPEAQVAAPLTAIRSTTTGAVVAFDRDRAYWFEGVPSATPLELHALRDASSSYRAVAYGDLTELHVGVRDGARTVDATDRDGRSWRVAISPNDVAAVQGALDRVDVKLGKRRPALSPAGGTTVRWLALALLIVLASAGEVGVTVIPLIVVLIRPLMSAALAATAAIALARILLAARTILWADPVRQMLLLGSLTATILLAVQATRRIRLDTSRGNGRRLTREAWMIAGPLALLSVLLASSVWSLFVQRPASLMSHPLAIGCATALFGAAAALYTIPNRWWRGGAALIGTLAFGGGAYLSGDGWLTNRLPALSWKSPRLTAAGVVRVGGGGVTMTASPNGTAFAVMQYGSPRRGGAGAHYVLARFGDTAQSVRSSTAARVVFIDEESFLAVDSAGTDSLELRAERIELDANGKTQIHWRQRLPGVEDPEILIDRARRSWIVVGRGDGDWSFVVMTDTIGGTAPRVYRLSGRSPNDVGEVLTHPLSAFADGGAIWSTLQGFRGEDGMVTPLLIASGGAGRWELRGSDPTGERFLADVEGFPACATELDAHGTLCVEHSPNGTHVLRASSAKALTRIAELPPTLDVVHAESSDRVAAAERFGQRAAVLDVITRQAFRVTLPGGAANREARRWTADLVARGPYLLVLSAGRDGAMVTRFAIR